MYRGRQSTNRAESIEIGDAGDVVFEFEDVKSWLFVGVCGAKRVHRSVEVSRRNDHLKASLCDGFGDIGRSDGRVSRVVAGEMTSPRAAE